MEHVTYVQFALERCKDCFGLFGSPEVLAEMKHEWMSEVLDKGDPKEGRKYDNVGEIMCPRCNVAMTNLSDPKQSHIWFEQCPGCEGIFFDAGEFSDWKYDTFIDRIRDLVKAPRK